MISLLTSLLFVALAIGSCWAAWKLSSTPRGMLLSFSTLLAGLFVVSLVYWVHFYLGDGSWPFYLTWSSLGASFLVFLTSLAVSVFARKKEANQPPEPTAPSRRGSP